MGKKMKLPSLLRNNKKPSSSSWPWPSCHQPRTLSFRGKTINSFHSEEDDSTKGDPLETLIRGLRSDRLFVQPDQTSSILEAKPSTTAFPFKDTILISLQSPHPYVDFRRSMEEMVEAQCVNDLEGLQQLLSWYLKVNGTTNHAYIIAAFVDLLLDSSSSSLSSSSSSSSPLSFYSSSSCTTPCVSCLEADHVDIPTHASFLPQQVRKDQASSSSSSSSFNNY